MFQKSLKANGIKIGPNQGQSSSNAPRPLGGNSGSNSSGSGGCC